LDLPGHLHTFRHAFISRALIAGTPEAIVRQCVGRVDRDVIRPYTHIGDTASREAMQRLDRVAGHEGVDHEFPQDGDSVQS
jgi:hypothetical protein